MVGHLIRGCTLGNDDLKLPLASGTFEERLYRFRVPCCHDDLIGVYVVQGLGGYIIGTGGRGQLLIVVMNISLL